MNPASGHDSTDGGAHSTSESADADRARAQFILCRDLEPLISNALCASRLAVMATEYPSMNNESVYASLRASEAVEALQARFYQLIAA